MQSLNGPPVSPLSLAWEVLGLAAACSVVLIGMWHGKQALQQLEEEQRRTEEEEEGEEGGELEMSVGGLGVGGRERKREGGLSFSGGSPSAVMKPLWDIDLEEQGEGGVGERRGERDGGREEAVVVREGEPVVSHGGQQKRGYMRLEEQQEEPGVREGWNSEGSIQDHSRKGGFANEHTGSDWHELEAQLSEVDLSDSPRGREGAIRGLGQEDSQVYDC